MTDNVVDLARQLAESEEARMVELDRAAASRDNIVALRTRVRALKDENTTQQERILQLETRLAQQANDHRMYCMGMERVIAQLIEAMSV